MTKAPFESIVAQHGETVLRVCRAVLGPHDAQDAWSETFLAALRAYPDLADDANVQAWLVTIAHRKSIDITRSRSRQPVPVESPPERARTASDPDIGAGQWGADELWADVAALPTKQRRAVAYHYLAGLPHREVAEILGGTTDAARRAAADGINSLRRKYSRTLEPNGSVR